MVQAQARAATAAEREARLSEMEKFYEKRLKDQVRPFSASDSLLLTKSAGRRGRVQARRQARHSLSPVRTQALAVVLVRRLGRGRRARGRHRGSLCCRNARLDRHRGTILPLTDSPALATADKAQPALTDRRRRLSRARALALANIRLAAPRAPGPRRDAHRPR